MTQGAGWGVGKVGTAMPYRPGVLTSSFFCKSWR